MVTTIFIPGYLNLSDEELKKRASEALKELSGCRLCPRDCRVDRVSGQIGSCRSGATVAVASYGPHFGEEAPLVGWGGSGTIFFSGCAMRCVFCQNYDISQRPIGEPMNAERLGRVMMELQERGCHNINLVTPTHFVPQIIAGLVHARRFGLKLPLVYNSSGFDSLITLELMDGLVDIYMPDFKYIIDDAAKRYSRATRYPETVKLALKEMHRQVGDLVIHEGIAQRGLLIRHLVLPENAAGTSEIIEWISKEISAASYVNIMDQYRPMHKANSYPPLDRPLTIKEYNDAITAAARLGLRLDNWRRLEF